MSPYFEFKCNSALNKEGNSNKFACWPNKGVQRELGLANSGSLGTANSSGVSVTTNRSTSSDISPPTVADVTRAAGPGINRDTDNGRETGHNSGTAGSEGLRLHQQQEIPVGTITRACVPGSSNFDGIDASVFTQRESGPHPTGSQTVTFKVRSVSTETSNLRGHDDSGKTGHPGGSAVSSALASSHKQSGAISLLYRGSETELSSAGQNVSGGHTGVGVVDARNTESQWGSFDNGSTRSGDRIGCISSGLGSNLKRSRTEDRGSVVDQRTGDAYKLPRVASSIAGDSDICQGEEKYQHIGENRQCVGQGIHKPLWRNSLMANELPSCADMEVVYRAPDISDSRAPSRSDESSSRRRIKDSARSLRLDASPSTVLTDREESGSPRGGHVCIPPDAPASTLFQLETGSGSGSNGCLHSGLESVSRVCKSPVVSPLAYSGKNSAGEGQSGLGGTTVEDTAVVSPPTSIADWNSSSDSSTTGCGDFTNTGGVHNASRSATAGRLAIIRHQSRSGGLSEGASRLLESSWRDKTKSTYESLFKRWVGWCQERSRDPIRGPLTDVLNFLAELFDQGYQYRSLNSYRSAISSVHEKVDGMEVGKHPLVSRVLKGVFNERPPRPKYASVWSVDLVLSMFKKDGDSTSLSLQDLTIKTAMLLALTRPCRGADLAELDLRNRSYVQEGVVFQPSHLSKQSRPSHHNVKFFFPKYEEDRCLCPVEALKAYEERTLPFRNNLGENRVFRSFIGKHGPVTSSTIARWIKSCLQKAGVDTSKFKAHSTRAAAATKAAMSGLTVDEIMKAADWSSEGVFQKFYYRPQHSVEFGSSVLAASASKSHVDMETEPSEV